MAGTVSPWERMPSRWPVWLSAISTLEADTKPDVTGLLRKLARNPSCNTAMPISISPLSRARTSAPSR